MRLKTRKRGPVPADIANAVTWVESQGMNEWEYIEEVKRVVRAVVQSGDVDWNDYGAIEEYDDRIWEMIEEALESN